MRKDSEENRPILVNNLAKLDHFLGDEENTIMKIGYCKIKDMFQYRRGGILPTNLIISIDLTKYHQGLKFSHKLMKDRNFSIDHRKIDKCLK